MTDEIESLVLAQLRELRNDVRSFRAGMNDQFDDVKARLSSLEASVVSVRRDVTHGEDTDARQQLSLDRIVKRLERIEQRLELTD